MNAPIIPPTVLLGLNGDNGLRAQRKRRNPFPPHQAATSAAEAAKATRKVSGHNITRWAKDQQIHTEPKPVNAVRLPPCSTSPLSTEGSEQANTTIGARPNSDGRSHAANGYRTANPSNTTVSTPLSFTRRTYSITATTASAAANAAVGPRPDPDRYADYRCDEKPGGPLLDQFPPARYEHGDTADRQDRDCDPHEEHGAYRWMCSGPRSMLSGMRRSK